MRRGSRGGLKQSNPNSQQSHYQNWRIKPSYEQTASPSSSSSAAAAATSASSTSTSVPLSEFIPKTPNSPRNRRNSRWVSRKKRGYGVKFDSNKTSESDSVNSCEEDEEEANSEQVRDSNSENVKEKEEGKKIDGLVPNKVGSVNKEEEEKKNDGAGTDKDLNGDNVIENGDSDSENKVVESDIVSRLQELRLGEKEPELSEEILSTNDQLQQDELVAMESIYGENVFFLDKQSSLRAFQIHVCIQSPRDLTISTQLNSASDIETKPDSSCEFSYSFKVQYLPPIILTCLLPLSYPSHRAPYFTIYVQWLDSSKISDLCSMLDSIWNGQPGQEVIYQWVEWLSSSSLSYLGFDEEIILGLYGIRDAGDKRAISGCVSPHVVIPSMKTYNDEQCHANFCKNFHECCICYSEFTGMEFIRLPCQHFFCCTCMKTYADIHVKEGTKTKLLCPEAKCGGMVPPGLLKRLLGDEVFECWESVMLKRSLESMPDVAYCPRCETACIQDEDNHAQCSKCFYSFCTLCRDRRHVGITCMTPEMKLLVLQEQQKSSQLIGKQKHHVQEMINELLSVKEVLRFAKQCPNCKIAISRTEGCNKMACANCGCYFCYLCNQQIEGYEHFRDGTCELFPQDMIQNWEQINGRQIRQLQAQLFHAQGHHSCPLCGQVNAKVGNNNHIFCWACRNHYCYLCKKLVKRGSNHYGPKGCKQHTEG